MYDTYPPVDLAGKASIPVAFASQVSASVAVCVVALIVVVTVCVAERKVVAP